MNNYQLIDASEVSDSHIDALSSATSFSALHQIAFFDSFPLNYSFLLEEKGEIVAACPFVVERKTINGVYYKIGSLLNLSLPGPLILHNDNNKKNIKKIVRTIFQIIDENAWKANVSKIQYNFSHLDCWNEMSSIFYKELYKRHYIDVSLLSQRLDITKCPDTIMKQVSKGHRAILKKKNMKVMFQNVDNLEISFSEFKKKMNVYHMGDNILKIFFKLYQKNRLEFCDIYFNSEEVGSLVFLKNNRDVSYYLSHKNTGIDQPVHHKGLWAAIEKYHFEKYLFLDFGAAFFGKNINYIPSTKQLGITDFKSGFGGEVYPFIRFEKFFDANLYDFEQNQKIYNYKKSYFDE